MDGGREESQGGWKGVVEGVERNNVVRQEHTLSGRSAGLEGEEGPVWILWSPWACSSRRGLGDLE